MKRRWIITAGVALISAAAGAAAGITGGTAATTGKGARAGSAAAHGGWALRGRPPLAHGFAVHDVAVVLNKAGDGFITVTSDSGTLQSVSGDQLTLKEAVGSATYRTVTLTIPSGATVMRNFKAASLFDLRAGDRVHVSSSTEGTTVLADDGSTLPPRDGMRPHAGPPPAAPGALGAPGAPGGAAPGIPY
jgi:hypothetical protein